MQPTRVRGRLLWAPLTANGQAMTETHCETALKHIQRVVTIASSDPAPITLAEALEQIAETLDLAGFAPGLLEASAAAAESPRATLQ